MIDCLMQILPLKSPATASSVAELAQRRLRESPYYFLKQIRCEYRAGVLTLRGTVPMWQLRQFAEAIVARVEGVRSIENEVEVFDPLSEPIAVRAARSA
jgi:osmotically-inducible protein OsmY